MVLNWFEDEVIARVENAANINGIAYQILALAQVGITDMDRIDTGFYRNSGYVVEIDGSSNYEETQASGKYSGRSGASQSRERAPQRQPKANHAMVGFAANYAANLEELDGSLGRAVQQAGARLQKVVKKL